MKAMKAMKAGEAAARIARDVCKRLYYASSYLRTEFESGSISETGSDCIIFNCLRRIVFVDLL